MSVDCYEYRAVGKDDGDLRPEHGATFGSRDEAKRDLDKMLTADPPYDECWIERRLCVEWERVPERCSCGAPAIGQHPRTGVATCGHPACAVHQSLVSGGSTRKRP